MGSGMRAGAWPALRLLAGAAALWLVHDTVYALLLQYGSYSTDNPINGVWLLGFVLFGATGLHPSMSELTEPAAERPPAATTRRG
jgi:two-component system, cell cycle response regulator